MRDLPDLKVAQWVPWMGQPSLPEQGPIRELLQEKA